MGKEFFIEGLSEAGTKTPVNQDACFAGTIDLADSKIVFAIVCDGMGGTEHGELASATIIDEFRKWFYTKSDLGENWYPDSYEVHQEWDSIVKTCNAQIIKYGEDNGINLGSTLVVCLVSDENIMVMNVGDSRIYHISEHVRKLSHDHSVVGQDIENGVITEDEAKKDKRRNVLTQCIGIVREIDPFYACYPTEAGYYILCSDGFYSEITNAELLNCCLSTNMDINTLKNMLQFIVKADRERGEKDDITVISILVK